MVEVLSKEKMQQNIEDYERVLDEFERMFMNIQGDLDFSKLKSLEETKSEITPEERKEEKRRQSAVIKFEVCDQFGFIKQEVKASEQESEEEQKSSDISQASETESTERDSSKIARGERTDSSKSSGSGNKPLVNGLRRSTGDALKAKQVEDQTL